MRKTWWSGAQVEAPYWTRELNSPLVTSVQLHKESFLERDVYSAHEVADKMFDDLISVLL